MQPPGMLPVKAACTALTVTVIAPAVRPVHPVAPTVETGECVPVCRVVYGGAMSLMVRPLSADAPPFVACIWYSMQFPDAADCTPVEKDDDAGPRVFK